MEYASVARSRATLGLRLALLLFVPAKVLNRFYPAPIYAVSQRFAQLRMRAAASAVILFVINLMGLGVSRQLIGPAQRLARARARIGNHSLLARGDRPLQHRGAAHHLRFTHWLAADLEPRSTG